MATNLEQQLGQLEELLNLLDANALKQAQEAIEHQIAELSERFEMTRQALAQAQVQRRRLARARLLLEEEAGERSTSDPAMRPLTAPATVEAKQEALTATAPYIADRRESEDRRKAPRRSADAIASNGA